jgi:hypothetical protein
MLRDNLAGLIEPMTSTAREFIPSVVISKKDKQGDAPGPPPWQSSLGSDPGAKFFTGKRGNRQEKQNGPVLK